MSQDNAPGHAALAMNVPKAGPLRPGRIFIAVPRVQPVLHLPLLPLPLGLFPQVKAKFRAGFFLFKVVFGKECLLQAIGVIGGKNVIHVKLRKRFQQGIASVDHGLHGFGQPLFLL